MKCDLRYEFKIRAYRHFGLQHPWQLVVWLMPQRLRYWVLIDQGVKHIGGPTRPHEEVPAVPFTVVLERCSKVGAGAR